MRNKTVKLLTVVAMIVLAYLAAACGFWLLAAAWHTLKFIAKLLCGIILTASAVCIMVLAVTMLHGDKKK